MKKRVLAMAMAAMMAIAATACSGGDGSNSSTSTNASQTGEASAASSVETPASGTAETPAGDFKVAMITDSGDITDQSFNQTTYEACQAFCEENGVDFLYYKPEGDSTEARDAKFDQAVADGYNIIVLPGYMFGPTVADKAAMYPDVKIIALDVTAFDIDPETFTIPENVFSAVYQEELSGYMAGYAAVKMGYTHLGFLGGMEVPAVQRYGYGYVQGADAAAKELGNTADVKVEYVYGGQFYGDADITGYTDTWFKTKGVEVVFACGGGIFTSAAESATKEGVNGKVIGVDSDQAPTIDGQYGEGLTLTSAMKGLDVTVKDALSAIILNNTWDNYKGQSLTLGIVSDNPEENFVQLPMATTQWSDTFTQDDYKAIVKGINSGEIKVSGDIENTPAVEITVDYQGSIK